MRPRLVPLVLLLSLVPLASCGGDDKTASTADATTTTTSEVPAAAAVYLDAEGLVVQHEDASRDEVYFPRPRQEAIDVVSSVLGTPVAEGQEDECPAGETFFVRFGKAPNDISLEFQNDTFVGWTLGAESDAKSEAGLGLGSTKADLEELYGPVEIDTTSTIGLEFFVADSLGGLLSEDAPTGEITALWAGTICIFR